MGDHVHDASRRDARDSARSDDDQVVLRETPATRVAVLRFSGRWTDAKYAAKTKALRAWLAARDLMAVGEPEVNRYDSPWTPWFLRRNEIWLTLA